MYPFILISVKTNSCQDKLESYYGFACVENNPVKAKMVENAKASSGQLKAE
jgi:hypothetical protein